MESWPPPLKVFIILKDPVSIPFTLSNGAQQMCFSYRPLSNDVVPYVR